nr:MAG TPA: hypothetical protein [Caudoviricetes sp.]
MHKKTLRYSQTLTSQESQRKNNAADRNRTVLLNLKY